MAEYKNCLINITKPLRNLQLNSGFHKHFMRLRSSENKHKNNFTELRCLLEQLASSLTQIPTQSTLTTVHYFRHLEAVTECLQLVLAVIIKVPSKMTRLFDTAIMPHSPTLLFRHFYRCFVTFTIFTHFKLF